VIGEDCAFDASRPAQSPAALRQGHTPLEPRTVARLACRTTDRALAGPPAKTAAEMLGRGEAAFAVQPGTGSAGVLTRGGVKRRSLSSAQASSKPVMSVRPSASRNVSTDTSWSMFVSDRNTLTLRPVACSTTLVNSSAICC
jgi:hypothetical protein